MATVQPQDLCAIGDYFTNGVNLYCVLDLGGDTVILEDCYTREETRLKLDAFAKLDRVEPSKPKKKD